MKKKVLVCGASGFMGQNIIEQLIDNYDVYGVHYSTNIETPIASKLKTLYTCDLTTQTGINHIFKNENFDIVIQAAATTSGAKDIIERPYIHVTDNVIMNSLVLRACFDYNVKHVIFLSCGVMYQPGNEPRKETDFNGNDELFPAYFGGGWMKIYIEKQMEFYSRLGKTKHTVIRHSNTYGPYDKYDYEYSHVFGATIRKVMDASDTIEVWGTGEETSRDLVYVKDITELIDSVITNQSTPFELVNAGTGKAFTVKELVEKIIHYSGKNLKIKYNSNKPVIPTKLAFDSTLAKEKFGWYAKTDLDSGIKKTLDWYKDWYKKYYMNGGKNES